MDFNYLAYTAEKKIVKGKISASNEEAAAQILVHSGCRVLSVKPVNVLLPESKKLMSFLYKIPPAAIIQFSRQLALLLESGNDIVSALELMRVQAPDRTLKKVLVDVISDLRGGSRLSVALGKHGENFPQIYCRALSVGERTGGLEIVLRQMADFMEKEIATSKNIKGALKYPIIVSIVSLMVIVLIVTFVLPAFTGLYTQLGVELPPMTLLLLSIVDWFSAYGLYLIGAILFIFMAIYIYIKTPEGKLMWDGFLLKIPMMGRISKLNELAHCCRSMALLFRAGLPLPEVMTLVVEGCENRAVKKGLDDVRQAMIKGEGLSQPMSRSRLFLPLMVQMISVGEETGNLDATLTAVAQSFEMEAEDKMKSLIGLIQPTMTIVIGGIVAFIVLSLVSAMYSVYGQMGV